VSENTQQGQGLQVAGNVITELGDRMFQDALVAQQQKLETEATQTLTELETQALQDPDFRDAPEKFREQARDKVRELVDRANPTLQGQVQQNLSRRVASSTAELRRRAVRKSQDEARQAVELQAESSRKAYANATNQTQMQQAIESLQQVTQRAVQSGALSEEEADIRLNQARAEFDVERIERFRSSGQLSAAENLAADSEFITEKQRRVLLEQIENDREQEVQQLSGEVNEIVDHVNRFGAMPSTLSDGTPTSQVVSAVAGTELGRAIDQAQSNAATINQHVNLPLDEQRSIVQDMQEKGRAGELSTDQGKLLQPLAQATENAAEAFNDGRALDHLERIGQVQLDPLFAEDGSINERALRQRKQVAKGKAKKYFGQAPVPLRSNERAAIEQITQQGNAEEIQQTYRVLHDNLGSKLTRRVAQSFAGDNPTKALALYNAADQPETSRVMLEADDAADNIDPALSAGDIRPIVQRTYGGAFQADASGKTLNAHVEAAKNVYAMWSQRTGALDDEFGSDDEDRFERALRFVAKGKLNLNGGVDGGPIEINGAKTLPPKAGASQDQVRRAFRSLDSARLEQFGNGQPVYQDPASGDLRIVSPEDIKSDGRLVYQGNGEYAIQLGRDRRGALLAARPTEGAGNMQLTGEPYTLDLETLMEELGNAPKPEPAEPAQPGPGGRGSL
jgi:hypothetical protein